MNELVSAPISPWYTIPAAVGLLALTFVFAPGVLLHIGVLIYPKGHARRREFTAELHTVPYINRPFWVAGNLVRCIFEGTSARFRAIRATRADRETGRFRPTISLEQHLHLTRMVKRRLDKENRRSDGEKFAENIVTFVDLGRSQWTASSNKPIDEIGLLNLDSLEFTRVNIPRKLGNRIRALLELPPA